VLEINDLFAGYNGTDVIYNINFNVQKGESLCVLGPNGCGKSTLLKSIARIIDYRGSIKINGSDISGISRKDFAKKIAMLSQNAQVYFPYTVYETVSMGRYAHSRSFFKNFTDEDKSVIEDVMKKMDLWEIKDNMIDELSGGTLQRVFLARTFAQVPDIILLDEPANHLDLKHQIELLNLLKNWSKDNNITLIGVFHDLNLARIFSDTAIILNNGKIAASGKTNDVLNSKIINDVFGINIRDYMKISFDYWNN